MGALITAAYWAVPLWIADITWSLFPQQLRTGEWWNWYVEILSLAFGVILVSGAWKRSGLRIGDIRSYWRRVLVVCGIPVVLTAVVYRFLPTRPFAGMPATMWLTSPWAQDLVFAGYLYGRFDEIVPSYIHRRVPVRWALVLGACFFSLHHLPNLLTTSAAYVLFQLAYTFLGGMLTGLARQWTGSIFYGAVAHMAVNLIAWGTR